MATHSSVLAWGIPETGEPGGLPSMGHTESDIAEATQQQQQGEHPCPISGIRGNAFIFLPLMMMFTLGLSYMTFILLRYVPSIPAF